MSRIIMSTRAISPLKKFIMDQGFQVKYIDGSGRKVDPRISSHADLYYCQIGLCKEARVYEGDPHLPQAPYPKDAIYNGVATGKYFIHNQLITDEKLLESVKGLTMVPVKQGYARCSCLPVTDNSFITSDGGMGKALKKAGCQLLEIMPGHIKLEGFDYGFIGGTCGNILIDDQPVLIFNGGLDSHPDGEKITDFAKGHQVTIIDFPGYPLEDIGSILFSYI